MTLEERIDTLERLMLEQAALLTAAHTELARLQPGTDTPEGISPETEAASTASLPNQDAPALAGWPGSHPFISRDGGAPLIEFTGRMHLDYRGYTGRETPNSTFVLRRARIAVEGDFSEHYSYKVEADFADTGSALLRDTFINVRVNDAFQVRFGQFKMPFSQEELVSDNRVAFVDRSSVNALSPGRSPGFEIHGTVADSFDYWVSAANGRGELGTNDTSTPEVLGRLRFSPFSGALEGLSFGGAYGQSRGDGGKSFRGRTASRSVTFFSSLPVNGKMTRANGEFQWLHENFALRGEFAQSNQWREGLAPDGGNLPGVLSKGFHVDTAYVFGGTQTSNTGIVPDRAFLDDGGLGALQLVLRYENLQIDDGKTPNRGEAYTVGFNWWLNSFVRYQHNVAFERFQHPDRTGAFGRGRAISFLGRMQLMF